MAEVAIVSDNNPRTLYFGSLCLSACLTLGDYRVRLAVAVAISDNLSGAGEIPRYKNDSRIRLVLFASIWSSEVCYSESVCCWFPKDQESRLQVCELPEGCSPRLLWTQRSFGMARLADSLRGANELFSNEGTKINFAETTIVPYGG